MGKYIDGNGLSHFMGIIKGALSGKVDTVSGKGLSTNDYTTTEKDKLAGIAAGAEVNVQSDWNQSTSTADDYIKNKPTIPAANTTATNIKMDGTQSAGSASTYAKADHVHPTDTSRLAASSFTAANIASTLGTTAVGRATADASGNNIASTYATKDELGTATAGALQYKGTVSEESTITGAAYKKGWYYVVATAGTYVGKVCEVGDMLIAKQDKTATPANDWDAVQSNIEVLSNSEIDALWAAA